MDIKRSFYVITAEAKDGETSPIGRETEELILTEKNLADIKANDYFVVTETIEENEIENLVIFTDEEEEEDIIMYLAVEDGTDSSITTREVGTNKSDINFICRLLSGEDEGKGGQICRL